MRVSSGAFLLAGGFVVGVIGPPVWQMVLACAGLGAVVAVHEYLR